MMVPLVVLNTIGLTGAEVLLTELATHPHIAALPGHNFIEQDRCLYRPKRFEQMDPSSIFESLSLHQYTSMGRCWAGLTKHMDADQRSRYDRARHKQLFTAGLGAQRDFFSVVRAYMASYFEGSGHNVASARYWAFYGQNIALTYSESLSYADVHVINWANRVDFWLANIGQRMTWNALEACKYWIVNTLYQRRLSRTIDRYLEIDMQEFVADSGAGMQRICDFLGLPAAVGESNPIAGAGFLRYDAAVTSKLQGDAAEIKLIYGDHQVFRVAESIDSWCGELLAAPEMNRLLDRYAQYWNSTGHTNFDWIGPIEEQILESASEAAAQTGASNLSLDFYHRYHHVTSDNYDAPVCRLAHSLGCLEEEVVLPLQPAFIRTAIAYLENVARTYGKQAHSYVPIREGSIFRRLNSPEGQKKLAQLGLDGKWLALNALIDEVERKILKGIRPWPA